MEESNQEQKTEPKKRNDWKIFSAILGAAVIILLIVMIYPRVTGNVVLSGDNAGTKIVDFLNGQTGGGVTYVSSTDKGNVYEVLVSYNGQEIPVYVTKDGQYFVQSLVPITDINSTDTPTTNTPKEVPKTAKPVVDAYIFSYCPYGLQFEKGLQPVYDLLKNKADINIVAIGAMHGDFERTETLRQICVEKVYGKDKLWSYLKTFNTDTAIGACNGEATCVNPLIEKIYTANGIDKAKIESCMKTDAPAIYDAQGKKAQALGISGSPTFVINGVQVQVDRTPEAIKTAVCNAFTTAPSECSKTLSTSALTAGFGASAGASTGASC